MDEIDLNWIQQNGTIEGQKWTEKRKKKQNWLKYNLPVSKLNKGELKTTEPNQYEVNKSESNLNWIEPIWPKVNLTEQDWTEESRFELNRTELT